MLHRRSLNLEVISCLERTTQAVPVDVDAILARARASRKRFGDITVTDAMLRGLKAQRRF